MVTCEINAEEMMFISRRRLCGKADPVTRTVWTNIIEAIFKVDPVVALKCVPECVYRGFCPEMQSCGYCKNKIFDESVKFYRTGQLESSCTSDI